MDFFTALRISIWKGQFWAERINHWLDANGADIIIALLQFAVGFYLLKLIHSFCLRMLNRANVDKTSSNFILKFIHYFLLISLILLCLNQVGFPTTSLMAAFGAFGIAVGLALQNNMSNFASGLLILFFKPLKVGDWVQLDNLQGEVKKIDFMSTQIATKDYKMVFVPNSDITSKAVINYSHADYRYIEFLFDISYESDHHKAIELLHQVFDKEPKVIKDPGKRTEIGLYHFTENSLQIRALPKVDWNDYVQARYDILSAVKDIFDANGIDIPYPQRTLHVAKSVHVILDKPESINKQDTLNKQDIANKQEVDAKLLD